MKFSNVLPFVAAGSAFVLPSEQVFQELSIEQNHRGGNTLYEEAISTKDELLSSFKKHYDGVTETLLMLPSPRLMASATRSSTLHSMLSRGLSRSYSPSILTTRITARLTMGLTMGLTTHPMMVRITHRTMDRQSRLTAQFGSFSLAASTRPSSPSSSATTPS
jgi:hypothetical protein